MLILFLVIETPKINVTSPLIITAGRNLHIKCQSVGYGKLTYRWLHNSRVIHNGSDLFIPTIRPSDEGDYICNVMNDQVKKSTSFELNIQCKIFLYHFYLFRFSSKILIEVALNTLRNWRCSVRKMFLEISQN